MIINKGVFQHDNPFTIGIEEEYMLCHPDSGDLINRANEIMDSIGSELQYRYSYELLLSEIEINTSVCKTVSEAIEEIRQNAMSNFPAQNRAVTKEDYIVRTYSLRPKYGNIAKAFMVQDDQLISKIR